MNEGATENHTHRIKLVGVLGTAAGKREMLLAGEVGMTLAHLISKLVVDVDTRQFEELLIDSATKNPLPNVIILLDDQDCNLFEGLETKLEPETQITIIPVAHGG